MTNWPNQEKSCAVLRTDRPVTHNALVAVNNASINEIGSRPGLKETGKNKSVVPMAKIAEYQ
jgi:hypothetical protein